MAKEVIVDTASRRTIESQLERERRYLTRARKSGFSPTIIKHSEKRIRNYEARLDALD